MNERTRREDWCLDLVARPWAGERSLLLEIRQLLGRESGVTRVAAVASDSSVEPAELARGVPPGALDCAAAAKAVEVCVTRASPAALRHLYALVAGPCSFHVDELASTATWARYPERVRALGLLLVREAPRVEAVRFGLALLASVEGPVDRELLQDLGSHEPLSDAVAAVLLRPSTRDEKLVFALARRLHGWGRIHVVERLLETADPEIQRWLLREGFRNDVAHEWLAFTCAMAGELHRALEAPRVDAALLRGAAELLLALANGGAGPDLGDYPFANQAIRAWLAHLGRTVWDLHQLTALDALRDCAEVEPELRCSIAALAATPHAAELIERGLDSSRAEHFELAELGAQRRQQDTFAACERRVLASAPGLSFALVRLLEQATPSTIERALTAARLRIELDRPCPEPAGLLRAVVTELQRFPHSGQDFIDAALAGGSAHNRELALRTLAVWGRHVANDNRS